MTEDKLRISALNTLRYLAESSMKHERTDYGWGMVPAGIILGIIDSVEDASGIRS